MSRKKVRVAIIGVGNCASSLVQGIEYCKDPWSGPMPAPSSYFFKTPPQQFRDDVCREKTEAFIRAEGTSS